MEPSLPEYIRVSSDTFKTMNQAIEQGKRDYLDMPACFNDENTAIKYRVAQFIWDQVRAVDTSEPTQILEAINIIVK
jgi:hypothetical protein